MNNQEKRNTLTLSSKNSKKKENELNVSNDIKNQIQLRQQQLKVSIKDKILEKKRKDEDERIKKDEEERIKREEEERVKREEDKKRIIAENANKTSDKKVFTVKRNDFDKTKNFKDFKKNKFESKTENGNESDTDNNAENTTENIDTTSDNQTSSENKRKRFNKNFDGSKPKENGFRKRHKEIYNADNPTNFKTDKNRVEEKKEVKKVIDVNLVEVKKESTLSKKTFEKKDIDLEENNKKSKKALEENERVDRYIKNIHTYVFNEEVDAEDILNKARNNDKVSFRKKDRKKHVEPVQQKIYREVKIPDMVSVSDLADRMGEKTAVLVKKLFTMGMAVTANQIIDADTAELICTELGHKPTRVSDSDVENILKTEEGTEFVFRSPVVTVMGHVDHGKTSLLDSLRSTKIVEDEFGGITQHIGASRIEVGNKKFITFIDTPGHEAFTEMRMRGANITDIVVLVVAADDGIKDQTIEAINHTKAAGVPMIVAVNKIDKEGCDPEKVKHELLQQNVIVEEFGGDVMCVNVSAKNKLNLDKLLETILLQAEMLDLKAPVDCKASGAVIEAKMDLQRGPLATLLVQKGVLKIGDIVVAGANYGRVKKMIDDKRKNKEEAEPSAVVEILGLNTVPSAGNNFNVVSTEKEARDIISYRERQEKEQQAIKAGKRNLELMLKDIGSNKKQLAIIVKCDVSGSIEAINNSLMKLNNTEASIIVIHSGTGAINESDINLATVSDALVIGFNVRSSGKAIDMAKATGIEIRYYSIIYNIIDDIKNILTGLLDPIEKEEVLGQAEIRQVFNLSSFGMVAGCYVLTGEIQRNASIRLVRDGVVIYTGKIKALKRQKEDAKEVKHGYECGISIENYNDIKEKDILECFKITEEKRV